MTSRIFVFLAFGILLGSAPMLEAATIAKVDGVEVSDELLSAFAEGRTRKPVEELTAEEKERLTDELIKLVAVGTEARRQKLQAESEISAQLQLQEYSLLAQMLVSRHLESNPVTEELVRSRYDAKYAGVNQKEYKARHILVKSPTEATQIIAELNAGADFNQLAAERSIGPSGKDGGDLGWFTKDKMVPEFANAVVAMTSGSHSDDPVQTQYGWHVILKEAERDAPPPAIGAVGQELERELQQQAIDDLVNGIRDKAKVKTYQ